MGYKRFWIVLACLTVFGVLRFTTQPIVSGQIQGLRIVPDSLKRPWVRPSTPLPNPDAECRGARGGLIDDRLTEDLPHPSSNLHYAHSPDHFDNSYPEPTYGSYEALGLEKTWLTFSERYGPYGYGEEQEGYALTRVDWNTMNWGQLQDQCLLSRRNRSHEMEFFQEGVSPRLRLAHQAQLPEYTPDRTGRQAIVLRTWETFNYTLEDMWHVRSIITEAGLANQGEYTVFLLVDVKRKGGAKIHEDDKFYRQVLEESVPREFWDIAVLFHESLQVSWYPKIKEYSSFWQIMQPLQLFAHFYPEFDHFWQLEMDTRFTGHTGKMLQTFHEFGRKQPYKQSRERASWSYMTKVHGSYEEFAAGINLALEGGATVWGPMDTGISGLVPLGSRPPFDDPTKDNFEWLAGEDADLLLFTFAFDITRIQTHDDWPFVDWRSGFDAKLTRLASFPAQGRASRALLEAAHVGQRELGLRLHSEATLPTFALWHGLKIVQVPHPKFSFPERDVDELDMIYNGGKPTDFKDGIAHGAAPYRASAVRWYARPRTFDWASSLIEPVWRYWKNEDSKRVSHRHLTGRALSTNGHVPDQLPSFLKEVDGEVYAPNFMLHPRKTNHNP